MSGLVEFLVFESRSAASAAAAELLASLVRTKLDSSPQTGASLVVSGGSTPGRCFDLLSAEALEWSRVTIIPSDERWVDHHHPDSNERLIRGRLLKKQAGEAKVLSFFRPGIDASMAPGLIGADLEHTGRPFSASLLGMGEDGHFASLFPDFEGLHDALDPTGGAKCVTVQTAGSPHQRISLTLSALLDSAHIVLLIFGATKRAVFEAAIAGGSAYPIESLLKHSHAPITVIWAPATEFRGK